MSDLTRISDLPDSNIFNNNGPNNIAVQNELMNGNQYIPMNVHPNPYGNTIGQPSPIPLSSEQPVNQRLPSRDIPKDTMHLTNDAEIQANFLPPTPKNKRKYIEEEEDDDDDIGIGSYKTYKKKVEKENMMSLIISQIQTPLLAVLLFFIFQLGILKKVMYALFSNLGMYQEDGNLNTLGLVTKSLLFGILLFAIQMSIEGITNKFCM